MDALSLPPPPSSKGREGGSIIKSWRGSARNRALFRAYRMKQGERKIGKQVFFSFREAADQNREPHPSIRMLPRRDDTRARIRADEIPWLLSGGTRFKIYPRRVAFAIPKRRRGLDSLGRKAGQTARPGVGHKHKLQVSSWIDEAVLLAGAFQCRVYDTISCLLYSP